MYEGQNLNLFKILINLFLEVEDENMEENIQELLDHLINNIDSNRSEFEYIYQKAAEYYRNKNKPLKKEKILKFTNILRVSPYLFIYLLRFFMEALTGIQFPLETTFTFQEMELSM